MNLIGYLLCAQYVCAISKINDLQRRIYYDSVLNLESLIFLMEVNQMGEGECKQLIKDIVLPMRYFLAEMFDPKKGVVKLIEKRDKDRKFSDNEDSINKKIELDTKEFRDAQTNLKNKKEDDKKSDIKKDAGSTLLDVLRAASNLGLQAKTKYGLINKSLEKRNKLFEADKSQIAKYLFNAAHGKLIRDVEEYLNDNVENPQASRVEELINIKDAEKKDQKYFQMIENIDKAIAESDNIVRVQKREEDEFALIFGKQIKSNEIRQIKVSFNLGSMFLAPGMYVSISKVLMMPEKSVFIEKMTNMMLKPILTLTATNTVNSDTEKKENIVLFLKDVVSRTSSQYTDDIDAAFKARSTILDKFFRDEKDEIKDQKIERVDAALERRNRELLSKIESIKAEHFNDFLVLNQQIVNSYIRYINSNSKNDKMKVYEYFR